MSQGTSLRACLEQGTHNSDGNDDREAATVNGVTYCATCGYPVKR